MNILCLVVVYPLPDLAVAANIIVAYGEELLWLIS